MIYLVSNQKNLYSTNLYTKISPEEAIQKLSSESLLGADTETEGLDPYTHKLLTIQLGTQSFQIVWDCTTISIQLLKPILENPNIKTIWWNFGFDGKFLLHQKILPRNIYDGFIAEQLLWLGYPKGLHKMGLQEAGIHYCNVILDKSVRDSIPTMGLNDKFIEYAANDVKWEIPIYHKQLKLLEEEELSTALKLENEFVKVIAYIEYCGVKIDTEKWNLKIKQDAERMELALKKCNQWIIDNMPNSNFLYKDLQGDLFSDKPFNEDYQISLNWNSPQQMISLFNDLGINTIDKDGKQSTDSKVLKPQTEKCSLISLFLDYKEASQLCKTFGEKFLSQINPISNRLHANWHSIGTNTARVSCGRGGEDSINLLNIPADAFTRSCFVAEQGNRWISIDYSGQESCLLASIANDSLMLTELNREHGDIHSLVASIMFDELKDVPIDDIKSKYKSLRQEAKGYEFLIAYGGDYNTMMSNFGLSKEDAKAKYDRYMNGLYGVKQYQAYRRWDWFDKGYILLSPITKYRAHIYDYGQLKDDKEWISTLDWNEYKTLKVLEPENETVLRVKHFFKQKSSYDKNSINYPIQHAGAACAKLALVNFYYWLLEKNYIFKVKITIIPYDEINCEAPEDIANEVAQTLYNFMVKAGAIFCTRCKLDADISWDKDENHKDIEGKLPTYWIH